MQGGWGSTQAGGIAYVLKRSNFATMFSSTKGSEAVKAEPVEVELAPAPAPMTPEVGAPASAAPLVHEPSSWILHGTEYDSMREEDFMSPEGSRMSRLSQSDTPIATMEEVQLEADEANRADAQAGLQRPKGYIKLGSKVPFRVPRRPDDLTPSWMTTALQFKGLLPKDIKATEVTTKPIGEGGGVMGVIALVTITYNGEVPASAPKRMVAKFSPQGKAPLPRFVVKAIFMAESHFYNDFSISQGGMPRAECYLALYDRARRRPTFCMLLEDMMPATSFTRISGCDDLEKVRGPCSPAWHSAPNASHTRPSPAEPVAPHGSCRAALRLVISQLLAAVSAMARLHARWWEHGKAAPLDWCLHPVKVRRWPPTARIRRDASHVLSDGSLCEPLCESPSAAHESQQTSFCT